MEEFRFIVPSKRWETMVKEFLGPSAEEAEKAGHTLTVSKEQFRQGMEEFLKGENQDE